jgi:hypothetical protein
MLGTTKYMQGGLADAQDPSYCYRELKSGKVSGIYKQAFGMKQVQGEGGAIYLSDGSINLALNPQYAGREADFITLVLRPRISRV